jgi:cytochrome b pre-mRNA-processing protein 3
VILSIFRTKQKIDASLVLLERVTAASRASPLYLTAGVPDTFEGRFECLTLHAFLVMRRLRELPDPAGEVAQEFVDHVFAHLDQGLRQSGIGDLGVPKRMKKMAQGFYGRIDAYDSAMQGGDRAALEAALRRNITADADAGILAAYVQDRWADLAGCTLDELLNRDPVIHPPATPEPVSYPR